MNVVVVGMYAYAFYFNVRVYSPSLAILFYLPPSLFEYSFYLVSSRDVLYLSTILYIGTSDINAINV